MNSYIRANISPNQIPKVKKKLIGCQVVALLEEVISRHFSDYSAESMYHIHHHELLVFAESIVEYLFMEKFILIEEVEKVAISFFKEYFMRTHFKCLQSLLKKLIESIADKLTHSIDNEPVISKVFAFLVMCSNWNVGEEAEKWILVDSTVSPLAIAYDNDKDDLRMTLRRDFTCVVCFKVDRVDRESLQTTLLSYMSESTQKGYTIKLQDDKVFFHVALPIKGPEMTSELQIFDDVSSILRDNANFFYFESKFNSKDNLTHLRFQLNNSVFMHVQNFEDPFFKSRKQVLSVLDNTCFQLSGICVLNKALNANKIQEIQLRLSASGLSSVAAIELFMQITEVNFRREEMWLFVHPFCVSDELALIDWVSEKRVPIQNAKACVEASAIQTDYRVIASDVLEVALSLSNFISSKSDFADFTKLVRNILVNSNVLKYEVLEWKHNVPKVLLSCFVSMKNTYFDTGFVDALFFILKSQERVTQRLLLNRLLFTFSFLDKVLVSDSLVIYYFEEYEKLIKENASSLDLLDLNDLTHSALLFLAETESHAHLKAFYMLKVTLQTLKTTDALTSFDFKRFIDYFFAPLKNQSVINKVALNIARHVQKKGVSRNHANKFVRGLCSMFYSIEEAVLLKPILKMLLQSMSVSEDFLINIWRYKFGREEDKADYGKVSENVQWEYVKRERMRNSSVVLHFIFEKSFDDVKKNNAFIVIENEVKKGGLINLLLEASLIAEQAVVERLLRAILVATTNTKSKFIERVNEECFVEWLVAMTFRVVINEDERILSQLTLDLLLAYFVKRQELHLTSKATADISHFKWISRVANTVKFFGFKSNNRTLKFVIFDTIIDHLNDKEIIFDNGAMLCSFVVAVYHYYFTNLSNDFVDGAYAKSMTNFLLVMHRNINLSPLQNVLELLCDDLTSMINSGSIVSSKLELIGWIKVKENCNCPLKFLIQLTISIIDCFSTKREYLSVVFEFVNAMMYRMNYSLDKNGAKMSRRVKYVIDVNTFNLFVYLFTNSALLEHLGEVIESIVYFGEMNKKADSLSARIAKQLRITRNETVADILRRLKLESLHTMIFVEELIDDDYTDRKQHFIAQSLTTINADIKTEASQWRSQVNFAKDIQRHNHELSVSSLKEFGKLNSLRRRFKQMYNRQLREVSLQLEPKEMYNRQLREVSAQSELKAHSNDLNAIKIKRRDFALRNMQTPFFKVKGQNRNCSKLKVKYDFALWRNLVFLKRGTLVFECKRVQGLKEVHSFLLFGSAGKVKLIATEFNSESISLKGIVEVMPFKQTQQKHAIVILMKSYQQVLLDFATEEDAATCLQTLLKSVIKTKLSYRQRLTRDWMAHRLSNFDYLMQLNVCASRTVASYSAYALFPLLFTKFDAMITLRDLAKPLCVSGSGDAYAQTIPQAERVCEFLDRVNSNGQLANQHFNSIQEMLDDALTLSELIPEFYYLPEMFVGLNGEPMANVTLPESCRESPYRFINMIRQLLESPLVSVKLAEWIDITFGYKQVKQVVSKVLSEPHPVKTITSEHQNLANQNSKTNYFLRYRDSDCEFVSRVIYVKKLKERERNKTKTMKKLLIVKINSIEIWAFNAVSKDKEHSNPYMMTLKEVFEFETIKSIHTSKGGYRDLSGVIEVTSGNRIIMGGVLNGSLVTFDYRKQRELSSQKLHEERIVQVRFIDDEQVMTVDSTSIIKVSVFDDGKSEFSVKRVFAQYFQANVVEIGVCSRDKRLTVINLDKSIEIRSLDEFRTVLVSFEKSRIPIFDDNSLTAKINTKAFLSLGIVNCVVVYTFYKRANHLLSLNLQGQVIAQYTLEDTQEPKFSCFELISDECFREHLIISNLKGDVFVFDLPFFENGRKISSNQSNKVFHLSMFRKNKLAVIVDEAGYIDILSTINTM